MTNEEIKSFPLVAVRFTADWCGPCKAIAPTWEEVAPKHEKIKSIVIDVDKSPSLAQTYGVRGIPMMIFLKDGVVTETLVGNKNSADLEAAFQKLSDS